MRGLNEKVHARVARDARQGGEQVLGRVCFRGTEVGLVWAEKRETGWTFLGRFGKIYCEMGLRSGICHWITKRFDQSVREDFELRFWKKGLEWES